MAQIRFGLCPSTAAAHPKRAAHPDSGSAPKTSAKKTKTLDHKPIDPWAVIRHMSRNPKGELMIPRVMPAECAPKLAAAGIPVYVKRWRAKLALGAEHVWCFSKNGIDRGQWWLLECLKRDPDEFGMYIYNDYATYGAMEAFENIVRPTYPIFAARRIS
ncbi:hypothetical protein CDD81_6854 [Ophiocordyceps australis]|uniref:Uncharacterized protein n=1 Tax=Ophiocordyceps australis TaxID=1399860 RepID=A0A2C5Y5A9_9HYPO|nr:hypothetical protein CDD81_6854 [Ophiocordyceps australis]